jgi:hypothetical protein
MTKDGVLKSARWVGVGFGLLAVLLVLLAAQAFLIYRIIFTESLAGYVASVLGALPYLLFLRFRKRPGVVTFSEFVWLDAALVAAATGPHLSALAGHLGWGHALPFAPISYCGYAVCAACISVAVVIMTRNVRRDGRPDTQARSDHA